MLKVLIKYVTIFLIYFGNFYAIGQTLIAVNGQILFQYSCHLVTLVVCPYLTSVGKTLQYCWVPRPKVTGFEALPWLHGGLRNEVSFLLNVAEACQVDALMMRDEDGCFHIAATCSCLPANIKMMNFKWVLPSERCLIERIYFQLSIQFDRSDKRWKKVYLSCRFNFCYFI